MFGIHDLLLFIVSGLILNITPGPDFFYVVSRSAGQGWKAGTVAALGVGTGCFVHMTCAALGLSAILAASATAYSVVKWVGAAYLVWVGISMLRTAHEGEGEQPQELVADMNDVSRDPSAAQVDSARSSDRGRLAAIYRQGFLTNALNPKVALFFLAFLPQFVDAGSTHKALAFLLLGAIFNFNGTLWFLFVAWSTARLSSAMQAGGRATVWLKRCAGLLFVGFGLRLAFSDAE